MLPIQLHIWLTILPAFLSCRVVRASLGAMSTRSDIDTFVMFLQETFVDRGLSRAVTPAQDGHDEVAGLSQDDAFYHGCNPVAAEEGVA